MSQALKGVNLGGWLVLEPWITPSLFAGTEAADEFSYCQQANAEQLGLGRLEAFRGDFIGLKDFRWLQKQGIEVVRIPVGYWLFGDEPPYQSTISYLDKAFEWATKTNIRILISLHGAPGSQNGHVHSGRAGDTTWHHKQSNVDQSLKVLNRLAERYKASPQLLGIGLLNEPASKVPRKLLRRYYRTAYQNIRRICGEGTWVVFSDGFAAWRWWRALRGPKYRNIYIDTHQYQIFTEGDKARNVAQHLQRTKTTVARRLRCIQRHHRVIVGEWSTALDSKSLRGLSKEQVARAYQDYYQVQRQVYDGMDAWFYWTYKTEDQGPWSFRKS